MSHLEEKLKAYEMALELTMVDTEARSAIKDLHELIELVADEQTSNLRRIIKNEMFIEEPEGEVDRWTNTVIDSVIELLERDDLLVTKNLTFNEK